MYIKIKNKKIEIKELDNFGKRFVSLKFVFKPIDYGVLVKKKRTASTYFFCQKVDILFVNKNNEIIKIARNVKTEKRIRKFKTRYIYYLPLNSTKDLNLGDIITLEKN